MFVRRATAVLLLGALSLVACSSSSKKTIYRQVGPNETTLLTVPGTDAAFCNSGKALQEKFRTLPSDRTGLTNAANDMEEIVRVAPTAIKADLQTLIDAYRKMAADQKVTADQKLVDAGTRIAQYIKDHCPGITTPSVSAP